MMNINHDNTHRHRRRHGNALAALSGGIFAAALLFAVGADATPPAWETGVRHETERMSENRSRIEKRARDLSGFIRRPDERHEPRTPRVPVYPRGFSPCAAGFSCPTPYAGGE